MNKRKRRSTLDDVARLANVSPITVSRALRIPDMVSDDLRSRILSAVTKLSYVPNMAASRLASSRSHAIGVVVPTLYNVIFAEYLQALHEVLLPAGFQAVVVNSRYSEEEEELAVRTLLGQRVEAIVMVGVKHAPQTRLLLKHARVPVVETFELSNDPIGVNIGLNQFEAGRDATRFLAGLGMKKISFIMGQMDVRAVERLHGFRFAMEEAGLTENAGISSLQKTSSVTLGAEIVRQIHSSGILPDALCCIDDNVALGALHECARLGTRVPDDISIIGFHDLEFAATASPSLSTVATRRYDMGKLAADTALRMIESGELESEVVDIGYQIVERGSTFAKS